MIMSYTDINGKRRRRSARIQRRSMDTIPEALCQEILSYLLGNDMNEIFRNYSMQFINKTFQRSFQHCLKTNPLKLYLSSWNGDHIYNNRMEYTLQLIRFVKSSNAHVHDLTISFEGVHYNNHDHIVEAMHDINFSSLRSLSLFVVVIDLELFKDCKELKRFHLGYDYEFFGVMSAKKMKTFLSLNKNTLEYLKLPADGVPNKLRRFSNLKELTIFDISRWTSTTVESDILEHLVLLLTHNYSHRRVVVKCPNLKVLFIGIENRNSFSRMELKTRSRQQYDEDICDDVRRAGGGFLYTCHPSELQKIGMVVEVSDDCDIGIAKDFYPEL